MKFNNFCKEVYVKNNIVNEVAINPTPAPAPAPAPAPEPPVSVSPYQISDTDKFLYTLDRIEKAANSGDGASKVLLEALQALASHIFNPKTTDWNAISRATAEVGNALGSMVPGMKS